MNTYDFKTGKLLNRSSVPQGLGLDTVWSRGQSWSIRGFAIAYRYTKLDRYLTAAQASVECFMRLLDIANDPSTGLPLWDFNATDSKLFASDSSALAIATAGIIEISLFSDSTTKARYLQAARKYLDILLSSQVLYTSSQSDAVLKNGTTSFPQYGIPLPYGDYYLFEAIRYWDNLP
jgi:unsaturated chondroitin disaccharide hydrolase